MKIKLTSKYTFDLAFDIENIQLRMFFFFKIVIESFHSSKLLAKMVFIQIKKIPVQMWFQVSHHEHKGESKLF